MQPRPKCGTPQKMLQTTKKRDEKFISLLIFPYFLIFFFSLNLFFSPTYGLYKKSRATLTLCRHCKQPAFSIIVHKSDNPEGFTRYNIVPGLIGIVLIFTGVMMTALAITRERERGTMENLLSMPVKPLEVMIGKIMPFVFIGLFQVGMVLLIARFLFAIPVLESVGLLFACALLFIICNLAIGFLISTIAKNQTQALQMSVFVLLPSIIMTGFMFPFQGMPDWAQAVGSCIPLTYFVRIVRGIMLKGAEFADILPNLWPLGVIVIFLTAVTMKAYKNTLD